MPVVTSPDQMHAELQSAFNAIVGDPLIIHSDLLRIGYAPKGRRIDQQLAVGHIVLITVPGTG